ncbi:hypothetical protein [Burkholderia vietnamiensis]|uniref:hypothetical protein n=1 Tax=Burkholderia vietnamiensis TaxID=60552 RepID=UPI00158BFC0E|nr:hypothetical protein [Burkholderia vietnamiensis]MCA8145413.1 hypothetical protein [Burkholderia vietnamiensis]
MATVKIEVLLACLNELALHLAERFPADVDFSRHEDCYWVFRASWPLHNQPEDRTTISREISIRIGKENLANYAEYDIEKKRLAREQLDAIVERRMAEYDDGSSLKRYEVKEPFIIDVHEEWATVA